MLPDPPTRMRAGTQIALTRYGSSAQAVLQPRPCASAHAVAATRAVRPETPSLP